MFTLLFYIFCGYMGYTALNIYYSEKDCESLWEKDRLCFLSLILLGHYALAGILLWICFCLLIDLFDLLGRRDPREDLVLY